MTDDFLGAKIRKNIEKAIKKKKKMLF